AAVAGAWLLLAGWPGWCAAPERVDGFRAAVWVLLALPFLALAPPALELPLLPAALEVVRSETPSVLWQGSVTPVEGLSLSSAIRPPSVAEVVLGLWMVGV